MNFNLNEKVLVVTGGSSGIGKAVAFEAIKHGANVVIVARNQDELDIVVNNIYSQTGKSISALCGDVSNWEQMNSVFSEVLNRFNHLDIVVNCAGINIRKGLFDTTEEEWDEVIRVNLKGTFICCRIAAEIMRQQQSGVIINISSVGAKRGSTSPQYSASKAGILGLSANLAKELAPSGIRVNVVCPGPVDNTRMALEWSQEKRQKLAEETLLKRLGTPDDIAKAIIFLSSDDASFITGEVLDVNGGMLID